MKPFGFILPEYVLRSVSIASLQKKSHFLLLYADAMVISFHSKSVFLPKCAQTFTYNYIYKLLCNSLWNQVCNYAIMLKIGMLAHKLWYRKIEISKHNSSRHPDRKDAEEQGEKDEHSEMVWKTFSSGPLTYKMFPGKKKRKTFQNKQKSQTNFPPAVNPPAEGDQSFSEKAAHRTSPANSSLRKMPVFPVSRCHLVEKALFVRSWWRALTSLWLSSLWFRTVLALMRTLPWPFITPAASSACPEICVSHS